MINNRINIILLLAILSSCISHSKKFTIEGKLPSSKYDGKWIYFVPIEGPKPLKIDSIQIEKSSFTFTGSKEQMVAIRTKPVICFFLQELLVVTEPGIIKVTIDSISSVGGTPQNNELQRWKSEREKNFKAYNFINKGIKNAKGKDSLQWAIAFDTLKVKSQRFNYEFLKLNYRNTLGRFIYKLDSASLTPAQRIALHESEK